MTLMAAGLHVQMPRRLRVSALRLFPDSGSWLHCCFDLPQAAPVLSRCSLLLPSVHADKAFLYGSSGSGLGCPWPKGSLPSTHSSNPYVRRTSPPVAVQPLSQSPGRPHAPDERPSLDAETDPGAGRIERQRLGWTVIWMPYHSAPRHDLFEGLHIPPRRPDPAQLKGLVQVGVGCKHAPADLRKSGSMMLLLLLDRSASAGPLRNNSRRVCSLHTTLVTWEGSGPGLRSKGSIQA